MEHDRGAVDTQGFFDHSPHMALIAGSDGRILRANAALVRALGRSEAELQSRRVGDLVEPSDQWLVEGALSAIRSPSRPIAFFARVARGGKALTPLRFDCSSSPDGALLYVTLTDVMSAAPGGDGKTKEASHHLELRLRALVRGLSIALIEFSPIGEAISWNPAAERLFGYTEAEALGRPYQELVVPPGMPGFNQDQHEELLREGSVTSVFPNVRKDGSRLLCEWHLLIVRDEPGNIFSVAALVRDVTERVATDRELRHSQDLLRAVLDNAPVVLWEADADGALTYFDGKGIRETAPEAVLGKRVFDIFHRNPAVLEDLKRGYRGENVSASHEVAGRVWEARYVPIRDADVNGGPVKGLIGVAFDVTERAGAEEELRNRLDIIEKQRSALRAMSMPIIQVWDDVLALPVVGVMDSGRAASIMETLLRAVAEARARYAIIDLTGVDVVDTHAAAHLVKVVRAVTLLGARAIVTGIEPAVAHVMVSLGVDVSSVTTVRNLREAIKLCMHEVA